MRDFGMRVSGVIIVYGFLLEPSMRNESRMKAKTMFGFHIPHALAIVFTIREQVEITVYGFNAVLISF